MSITQLIQLFPYKRSSCCIPRPTSEGQALIFQTTATITRGYVVGIDIKQCTIR
jgi:hypothetical protein